MPLSQYHQNFSNQSENRIRDKIRVKNEELVQIFQNVSVPSKLSYAIGVFGCGDKRFVSSHKQIFGEILHSKVELTTIDITIEHLEGEKNIIQHDCTLPLTKKFDIVYAHVLLKFIESGKQFLLIKNHTMLLNPEVLQSMCLILKKLNQNDRFFQADSITYHGINTLNYGLKNESVYRKFDCNMVLLSYLRNNKPGLLRKFKVTEINFCKTVIL